VVLLNDELVKFFREVQPPSIIRSARDLKSRLHFFWICVFEHDLLVFFEQEGVIFYPFWRFDVPEPQLDLLLVDVVAVDLKFLSGAIVTSFIVAISLRVCLSASSSGVSLRSIELERNAEIMWSDERKGVLPCSTSLM
jgi:hypothetical protein